MFNNPFIFGLLVKIRIRPSGFGLMYPTLSRVLKVLKLLISNQGTYQLVLINNWVVLFSYLRFNGIKVAKQNWKIIYLFET